jgi:ABC-type glycerol-3-phosphate transport system substrate-binding protein
MSRISTIVALLLGTASLLAGCDGSAESPRPIELVVWHTELDPNAKAFLDSLADRVEAELAQDSAFEGYPVSINITALDWGDVASRLFTNQQRPPDLTHLQPFMLSQVMRQFQNSDHRLLSLDTLIEQMQNQYGPIEPSVLNLQRLAVNGGADTLTYGLAHAVGTTFLAYRADWNRGGAPEPRTWEQLITFADSLRAHAPGSVKPAGFILPGGSSFFIDQLVNEMVVSMGGSLYKGGQPNFDSPEMRRALTVLQDMIARTGGRYTQTAYLQQFELFADGNGAVVPVTYGRATKRIEAMIDTLRVDSATKVRRRQDFRVMPQPGWDSNTQGVASIDAEPWVIFTNRNPSKISTLRVRAAQRFLLRYYQPENYQRFVGIVPVHLRPVFRNMRAQYDSLPSQQRWQHWVSVGRSMIDREGGTAPILLDPITRGTQIPIFALELQRTGVLSDLVLEAASDEVVSAVQSGLEGRPNPEESGIRETAIVRAINRAQARANQLYRQATQ